MNGPPAELEPEALALRPATPSDRELLFRVYASTRVEELAPVPWSEAQKESFLRLQFEAQDHEYRRNYPSASFDVVEVGGEPVGRLYRSLGSEELRIVDLALLPRARNRGVGTRLIRLVLDEAERARVPVSIHVEAFNTGARRLYERLGFAVVEDKGVYLFLVRPRAWIEVQR